jgi:hypothetical protein
VSPRFQPGETHPTGNQPETRLQTGRSFTQNLTRSEPMASLPARRVGDPWLLVAPCFSMGIRCTPGCNLKKDPHPARAKPRPKHHSVLAENVSALSPLQGLGSQSRATQSSTAHVRAQPSSFALGAVFREPEHVPGKRWQHDIETVVRKRRVGDSHRYDAVRFAGCVDKRRFNGLQPKRLVQSQFPA